MRDIFYFYLYQHGVEVSECRASMLSCVNIHLTLPGILWKDHNGAIQKMRSHLPSTCLCEDVVYNVGCQQGQCFSCWFDFFSYFSLVVLFHLPPYKVVGELTLMEDRPMKHFCFCVYRVVSGRKEISFASGTQVVS